MKIKIKYSHASCFSDGSFVVCLFYDLLKVRKITIFFYFFKSSKTTECNCYYIFKKIITIVIYKYEKILSLSLL